MHSATISHISETEEASPLEEIMLPTCRAWTAKKIKVRIFDAKPEPSLSMNRRCLALYFVYDGPNPTDNQLPSRIEIRPATGPRYKDNVDAISELYGQIEKGMMRAKREHGHRFCDITLSLEKIPNYVKRNASDPNFSLRHVVREGRNDVSVDEPQIAETNIYSFDDPSHLVRT